LNLQVFLEPSFFRRFHHCVIGVLVLGVVDHAGDNGNIIRQHRTARVDLSVSERQCLAFRFWVGDDERFPLLLICSSLTLASQSPFLLVVLVLSEANYYTTH